MKEGKMKNISMALLRAQKKIRNAKKDATNPHFKNEMNSALAGKPERR